MRWLTARVSCGGWERGRAVETEKLKARQMPKNAARTHRQLHALLGGGFLKLASHAHPFLIYNPKFSFNGFRREQL